MVKQTLCALFLLLSFLPTFVHAGTTCLLGGGACNACGPNYQCNGGTQDGKYFSGSNCVVGKKGDMLANGCYAQANLSCICAGCAAVQITGGVSTGCKTAACGGACAGVPEISHNWQRVFILLGAGVFMLGWNWYSQRKRFTKM